MAALKTPLFHKDLLTLTGKQRNTACPLVAIRQLMQSLVEFKVTYKRRHAPVNYFTNVLILFRPKYDINCNKNPALHYNHAFILKSMFSSITGTKY